MKGKFIFLLFTISILLGGRAMPVNGQEVTYTNPVGEMTDIGDPFVMKTNDMYYMYATSEPNFGFRVWQSEDLVNWEDAGIALDHRDFEKKWATYDFWAPEVIEYENAYYMTYSARAYNGSLRIAIAKSEDPLGPFTDINHDLVNETGSYIDGNILIDDDDRKYLYYVKDNYENIIGDQKVSEIFVQEMSEDFTELLGDPQQIIVPDQEWEGLDGDIVWVEGPFAFKHEEMYYITYSANFFGGPDYNVGYAVSESPMGPFEKYENNPILTSDVANGISGPGHNSIVEGLDGETMYIVYHIHTDPENPSGDRRMAMDVIYFDENGILTVDGPTSSEQVIKE